MLSALSYKFYLLALPIGLLMVKRRWRAVGGVALGVMALIVVIAVMTGFGKDLRDKILGTHSHVPDRVVKAAEAALEELEFKLVSASGTKLDGRIKARTAQGKDIVIMVEKEGEDVSKVTVKVGTLGDETISLAIIEKTKEHLKE